MKEMNRKERKDHKEKIQGLFSAIFAISAVKKLRSSPMRESACLSRTGAEQAAIVCP
jgi:hypothetical protein